MTQRDSSFRHVLNDGWLKLEDSMGDDLAIVNAARQSFGQESTEMGLYERNLIDFLMRGGPAPKNPDYPTTEEMLRIAKERTHGTPFEMVEFKFNVRCPISVAREWFRHRIASYNEMSGRYKKLEKSNYIPIYTDGNNQIRAHIRTQVGKPGQYSFDLLTGTPATEGMWKMMQAYDKCWQTYEELLELGWAKELARNVLPLGMYTQFTFKTNFRSLSNFIGLRSTEYAMQEIRSYSKAMEPMVKDIIPVTWEAWEKYGRKPI